MKTTTRTISIIAVSSFLMCCASHPSGVNLGDPQGSCHPTIDFVHGKPAVCVEADAPAWRQVSAAYVDPKTYDPATGSARQTQTIWLYPDQKCFVSPARLVLVEVGKCQIFGVKK